MAVEANAIGLAHHAGAFPDKPALILGDTTLTYSALNARVNRLARALTRAGVGTGDAVGAALHNGLAWLELLNAAGKIGAQLVPIGYRLKGPEIAYMLTDSRAKLLMGDAALQHEIDRAMTELAWPDDALWITGAETPWRGQSYEPRLAAESAAEPESAFVGGGFNVLVYTSGTTGRPKGIERHVEPATGHLMLLGIAHLWGFDAASVHLVTGPLYHTAPSSYAQIHLLVGGTVVLMPHFDAAEALHLIEQHHVTDTFMVPTHFVRILLLDERERKQHDLSSLRLVLHSAAPCPPHVKREIVDVFPPGVVTEFYGSSESGFTKITAEEWLRKPGSVGLPWPGHAIKIFDEHGHECPPGEVGLVYVKGPRLEFRYRGAADKTRNAFHDGFFTAGDLGYLDADGYLFIADRRTDLIITGGANVYPAEVESVLIRHPAVADVAVVGISDSDMGKSVLAVVELRPGTHATAEDLIAFARRDLAHYKCPRRIEFVEHLPREPQGKVRKHQLVTQYDHAPADPTIPVPADRVQRPIRPIVVVDYDPQWPQVFRRLRDRTWPVVQDFAGRMEHVGSTAVPGLAAKPIIDISIVVSTDAEVRLAIERLAGLGYRHLGDLGVEGREAFRQPDDLPAHNMYVCLEGGLGLQNQVAVRDYLRTHPDSARAYGVLKKQLAQAFPNDIEDYVYGKTDFVIAILRDAGLSPDRVEAIEIANRRK